MEFSFPLQSFIWLFIVGDLLSAAEAARSMTPADREVKMEVLVPIEKRRINETTV